MSTPRIYTQQTLKEGLDLVIEAEPSHHLNQVLRLKPGNSVVLFNGDGNEYTGTIQQTERRNLTARIQELLSTEPQPPLRISLMLGISRGERMDFAIQKAVELGATEIQPIFSERCMVKLKGDRLAQRMQHWQKIIISACEQSGRCRIPTLVDAQNLEESIDHRREEYTLLLGHRSDMSITDLPPPDGAATLLIGPEGGLSEAERDFAKRKGFREVRLGPRVLRTETAPLAAIAAMQTLWGDFRTR